MKTGYVVTVENIAYKWPSAFYLIDDKTQNIVKIFSSMEELNIYADLNDYQIKNGFSLVDFLQ